MEKIIVFAIIIIAIIVFISSLFIDYCYHRKRRKIVFLISIALLVIDFFLALFMNFYHIKRIEKMVEGHTIVSAFVEDTKFYEDAVLNLVYEDENGYLNEVHEKGFFHCDIESDSPVEIVRDNPSKYIPEVKIYEIN